MCPGGDDDTDTRNGNSSLTVWDKFEDKRFEQFLLVFPEDMPDRWQSIAAQLPGKSPADVREHYDALVNDVNLIVDGRVRVQDYPKLKCNKSNGAVRKKVSPWTEAEHKLFLLGLKKYGKGDWKSISRHVVITRDSTQVASHAQKYFHRHNSSSNKGRKRASIHDITTVDENLIPPRGGLIQQLPPLPMPVDQNWIPPTGSLVQQQPLATDQQQLSALQQYPPLSQFPGQGSSKDYPNYGYPM